MILHKHDHEAATLGAPLRLVLLHLPDEAAVKHLLAAGLLHLGLALLHRAWAVAVCFATGFATAAALRRLVPAPELAACRLQQARDDSLESKMTG